MHLPLDNNRQTGIVFFKISGGIVKHFQIKVIHHCCLHYFPCAPIDFRHNFKGFNASKIINLFVWAFLDHLKIESAIGTQL